MYARFLMATLRIPVRVGVDGDLILLNEYSKIEIGEMDGPMTTKTNETIYSKVIDYLAREEVQEPVKEEEQEPMQEEEQEPVQEEEQESMQEEEQEPMQEEEQEPVREEEQKYDEREPPKYKFPYMKKSKKPINTTFRAKNKSQNFTKKMYGM